MFSFRIIAENFEVFENDIFDYKVLWMVGEGKWNSVGFSVDFLGATFAWILTKTPHEYI